MILKSFFIHYFFKYYIKNKYFFLEEIGYNVSNDKRIISGWEKNVVYLKDNIVISLGFDWRERCFITIITRIQNNFQIPIYTDNFFTLSDYLFKYHKIIDFYKKVSYDSISDYEKVINYSLEMLKEHINHIEEVLNKRGDCIITPTL